MQFIWPIEGTVSRGWAYRSSIYVGGQHAAVDIPATTGTPIKSVAAGVVISVAKDMYSGFFVGIDHIDGWQSFYRHMYSQSPVVVGQTVVQGQIIGNVGSTGWSTGYHLHFDLWSKNPIEEAFQKHDIWAVDPELYLGVEEENNMTPEQEEKLLRDVKGLRDNQTRMDLQLQVLLNRHKGELSHPVTSSDDSKTLQEIAAGLKVEAR